MGKAANLVQETTATAGTGTLTLSATPGFARFADRFANGDTVHYCIDDGANWEIGIGTVGVGNTLARTTVQETYVGGVLTTASPTAINVSGANTVVRCVSSTQHLTSTFLQIANNLSDLTNAASARTSLGLGNVENKSSATIRSELTSSNVTTALTYTPVRPTDTFFIGTTSIAHNRTSAALSLAGVNIDGSAGSVPWTGVSGRPTALSSFTNDVGYAVGTTDTAASANTIAKRDASGYLYAVYLNQSSTNNENPTISQVMVTNGDNFLRKASLASLASQITAVGTWTPSVFAAAGAITSVSGSGWYYVIGNIVFFYVSISVTNNGTGTANLRFTVPHTMSRAATCSGIESVLTGYGVNGFAGAGTNQFLVVRYDNAYPVASGATLQMSGHYALS